jgi:hypothetical protein
VADQIPPWGRAHRRIEREAARELARTLVREGYRSEKFRWDITLSCLVAAMGIFLIVAPPQSRPVMAGCLIAMFALGVYPVLHFAEWFPIRNKGLARAAGIAGLAVAISALGVKEWPSIRRHLLDETERLSFENALRLQRGSDLDIQIACPDGDEKTCIYAGQFISLFGESEWKVEPFVSRLKLSRALDGIIVYRRGGNKEDMMKRWNSGGWFEINEPHLLAVQRAFRVSHIEIDGGSNPDLGENVMMIYIGPERDNEADPTSLTKETDWATGKTKGPFPK